MSDWESIAYSMQEKVKQLQQKLREKEARIAGLEKGLDYAGVKLLDHRDRRGYEVVDKILCETEPQQLAHIQADAVEDFVKSYEKGKFTGGTIGVMQAGLEYTQQLRDKADKD